MLAAARSALSVSLEALLLTPYYEQRFLLETGGSLADPTVERDLYYLSRVAHRDEVPALDAASERLLISYYRGTCRFESSFSFVQTLRREGLEFDVVGEPEGFSPNLLSGWKAKALAAIAFHIEHPERLGDIHIGHSAGALVVSALALLADPEVSADVVYDLLGGNPRDLPWSEVRKLARRLREKPRIYGSIAGPVNGVDPTWYGRIFNRQVAERLGVPILTEITREEMNAFWRKAGRTPADLIDVSLVGQGGINLRHYDPAHLAVRSGVRLFGGLLRGEDHDGIVPVASATIPGALQTFLPFDHLDLVERPEAAQALAHLIRQALQKS